MKHTKHTVSALLIVVLTLTPLSAIAQGGAELIVDDSIAGIGTLVDAHGAQGSEATLVVQSPDGDKKSVRMPLQNGAGSMTIPGSLTRTAGTYRIALTQDGETIASTTAAVLPESMDPVSSTLQADTRHIDADGRDEATVEVQLTDAYGNVLPGRPVTLISSRPDDYVTPLSHETDNDGIQAFAISTKEEGTVALRALDLLSGNLLAASLEINAGYGRGGDDDYAPASKHVSGQRMYYAQVSSGFDVIDGFEVTAPATMTAGVEAPKVTIRAVDRDGNIVEDYVGTVVFSSTDPDATLPNFGKYTFKQRDLGVKEFALVLKFRANGKQTFRVEDQNDDRISGEAEVTVSGGASGNTGTRNITVTSHKDGDSVSATQITLTGTAPALSNLIVMGGTEDVAGASDETGRFSIPVTLSATQRDFTIRIRDDAGRSDSGPIHLILDQQDPELKDIVFSPDEPQAGDKILVTVESEPKLKSVTMRLDNGLDAQPVVLKETGTTGSYQAVFTVDEAGAYQPIFTADDAAGNRTELRAILTVGIQSLPIVQNVRAEPRLNAVALEWDALTVPLDGYRVYVGDKEDNFLYTLDTQSLTTKATVAGLTPGRTYFFAVTAVKGDSESKEKSKLVQATVLGLTLEVGPLDGALAIKWSNLKADVPLASYLLEFGVQGEEFTESRFLNGELREYTLRDLLNAIPYQLRLTPISVTGQKLDDLAATGEGTPSAKGAGFKPSAADPIPFIDSVHPGGVAQPAPHTPGSGIPPFAWYLMAAAGCAGVYLRLRHRHNVQKTAAFLNAIQSQYRS